jgi:hypothetical protein
MERLWTRWPADADVVAAYEVRVGPFGVETVLYANGTMAVEQVLRALQEALENKLVGLAPCGEARRARNLDEPVACVHVEMASIGTVSVECGDDPSGNAPGGRAKAMALMAYGYADLEGRRSASA